MDLREATLPGGVRLAYRTAGTPDAPVLVLLHALGEDSGTWEVVASAFSSRFRVIAPDLRGHGGSDRPGAYTFELLRDDVLALLDVLDVVETVLVGHSLGGIVALLIAVAQPGRVRALVIEDAVPPFPRKRAAPDRPSGPLPFDWEAAVALAAQVDDPLRRWWPRLPEITAPTLFVGGGPASHIPQQLLAEAAAAIPGAAHVTVPVGHEVHERDPAAFLEVLRNMPTISG